MQPQNSPGLPPQSTIYQTPGPATPRKKFRIFGKIRSILGTVLLFILAPIIALSITAYGFQSYQVDGESMEPTLQNNDRLIVNKMNRSWAKFKDKHFIPPRGTIIIFNQNGLYDSAGNLERQLIKRVIGLPGEKVTVDNGIVTVFNKQNPSGFVPDKSGSYQITGHETSGSQSYELKENQLFVLGDNRPNSADSRVFGPIDADQLVGTLSMRIFPIGKARNF